MKRLLPGPNVSVLNVNKLTQYHIQADALTYVTLSICSSDAYTDVGMWRTLLANDDYPILLTSKDFIFYMHVPVLNYNKLVGTILKY